MDAMNRIDAADPDALLLLSFFLLCMLAIGIYLLAERMTKKRWPDGHGDKYWSSAKRVDME